MNFAMFANFGKPKTRFKDLKPGECFVYEGEYFLVMEQDVGLNNAVKLDSGKQFYFFGYEEVTKVADRLGR